MGERPIKALLDPYNPTGSTSHVRFNTSKTDRWETKGPPPSATSTGSCSTATGKPSSAAWPSRIRKVRAYVKNHNLGLEVPYRYGSETRKYLPDFIVLVDDGHGPRRPAAPHRRDQRLPARGREGEEIHHGHLLGARREPPRHYGRWAFAEFTEVYQIEADFKAKVESEFNKMIEAADAKPAA